MKIELSDLTRARGAFEKIVASKALEVAQKVTLDVHRNVVLASPVDTGKFRGAWTVETPIKPFQNGVIENNTEYGPALVEGHSKQAPTGWLEQAVKDAVK